jgi:hypothetical protein
VRAKASFQSSCGRKSQASGHPASGYVGRINQLSSVVEVPCRETFDLKPSASAADGIGPSTICVERLVECTGNTAVASKVRRDLPTMLAIEVSFPW